VCTPRSPGLGLSADRPAEPLRLSAGAWANCWFSALAPGRTAVSAPRAPSARGLGLSSADRLGELLVFGPGARANRCFRPPGAVGPGDLASPRTAASQLRRLGEPLVFSPAAWANCPGRISVTRRKAGFPGTWAAHGPRGRPAVFGPGRVAELLFLPRAHGADAR
jgi:hypothetical protein